MEEKERYIIDRFDGDIFDTKKGYYPSNQTICEIINQQDKQIKELKKENKELEIKLAESEKERDGNYENYSICWKDNEYLKQQLEDAEEHIDNLELQLREQYQLVDKKDEQLAEKEQEIEKLNNNWNVLCDYLGDCIIKYDEEDINGIYSEVLEKANKLKKYDTSIAKTQNQKALEQLKKVKEFFLEEHRDEEMDTDYIITKDAGEIADYLLDQIKQLKEVK